MKKTLHLALSGALMLAAAAAFAPAQAGPKVWTPITQAGGAPGNPALWDQEAGYRVFGQGGYPALNVSPQFTTVNDHSTTTVGPTTVQGSQTNVVTNAQQGDGSTLTATTNSTDGN